MGSKDRTKEQLLNEPEELPKQITELEAPREGRKCLEDALRKSDDDVQISTSPSSRCATYQMAVEQSKNTQARVLI